MLRIVPQNLSDIYNVFGNDLVLSATGDLQTVTGTERSNQRVIRRLLTTAPTYSWHPEYGAGLPTYVGQALSPNLYDQIRSTIQANIYQEASVAQIPQPVITLQTIQSGLYSQINYTVSPSLQPTVVNFSVGTQI